MIPTIKPGSTDYTPSFSFSEKDENGYPLVQYLLLGQDETILSEDPQALYDVCQYANPSLTFRQTPISEINEKTTATEFFRLCNQYPKYQLNHADIFVEMGPTAPTALAMAVYHENVDLVNAIIETIPDKKNRLLLVNQKMHRKITALFCFPKAITYKSQKILQALIRAGANLELASSFGTPLGYAIKRKRMQETQHLILEGAKAPESLTKELCTIDMIGLEKINLSPNNQYDELKKAIFFYEQFKMAEAKIKEDYIKKFTLMRLQVTFDPNESPFKYHDTRLLISLIFMTISYPEKSWLSNNKSTLNLNINSTPRYYWALKNLNVTK